MLVEREMKSRERGNWIPSVKQAILRETRNPSGVGVQSDSTSSSSSFEFQESSTPSSSGSLDVPECPEKPPKKVGVLRRWLRTFSACFGGCRGKKSVATQ
ncbi:hypothetical protein SKAU_G00153620 [Synaphobranchus kaupii]|uniref:Uncharacterized protein n=1 Tax=Synaphobranchus kaupii TaxID=118154 RepID=A0A9Q1FH52_SYNKA|nr:hypothetical protein SKAU_G00153620 [Synaphobranchus kaupii]